MDPVGGQRAGGAVSFAVPGKEGSCVATCAFDLGYRDEDMNPVYYASAKTSEARS